MIDRYRLQADSSLAFSENAHILEIVNSSLETYSEGILGAVGGAIGKGAGNVAVGVGKGAAGVGVGVAKGGFKAAVQTAQGVDKFVDDKVLKGKVGSAVKFYKKKLQTMFKTIIKAITKMLDNLYQSVFGVEKRLDRMVNDINMAITKRHPGGKYPATMNIITPVSLQKVGLDMSQPNSRGAILAGFLETVQKQPILEGVHFGDEKSLETAFETLVKRITGQGAPYEKITPENFRTNLKEQLNLFDAVDSNTTKKKVNGQKTVDMIDKFRVKTPGNEAAAQLEDSLNMLKETAVRFKELKAVEYLRKDKDHLSKIGDEIDKLVANAKEEELKQDNSNYQPANQASAASADITYAEGIFQSGSKQDKASKSAQKQAGDGSGIAPSNMTKEQELIHILLVEYSNSLNTTIYNLSQFYEGILTAGKDTLSDYYDITE